MRLRNRVGPAAAARAAVIALALRVGHAFNFTPVTSPNLDLSGLGRVALTGDFDSISVYSYQEQSEGLANNGSQALLAQIPNGAFDALLPADAYISAMAPFIRQDNSLAGVVVGGNFTSLGGTPAQGVALYDPTNNKIVPLPGLNGSVNAIYCNSPTDTVYVGGNFKGANSTNAIAWVGMRGWANTPFAGFNGPVNTITKAPDGNILFGGSFSGLGNTTLPSARDQQVISLSSANLTVSANSSTDGFNDPHNIICKTGGQDGPGNTWLLPDNAPGFWQADFNLGFRPTKLRLWNTHQDGRGVKTFRFTAFPINGIMNLTYSDPATGEDVPCDATCPLSNNKSAPFQDYKFVNPIGMDSIKIDISEWYGPGAGLNGIELFQDDIYAYAVDSLNEPTCATNSLRASASQTGPWTVTPSGDSGAQFLTASLGGPNVNAQSATITFLADVKQSGNYTVTIFTPGCQQDNSCGRRGIANVTGVFTTSGESVSQTIFQTNDFDKYDEIYSGRVDAGTSSFRPSVTLSPKNDQNDPINLVALRVRYEMLGNSTSSGLNGLFEYNPNMATVDTQFAKSKVNSAGTDLNTGADITSLVVMGQTTFIGGNFSNSSFSNIFALQDGNTVSLPNGGLNSAVASMYAFDDLLFVGGNFTDNAKGSTPGLQNVAMYNTSGKAWQALGAGVNGDVTAIVPILLNTSGNAQETCISVNGDFTQVLAAGSSKASDAKGLAIWVPSQNQWAHNLPNLTTQAVNGKLTTSVNVTDVGTLYAGSLSAQGMGYSGATGLTAQDGNPNLRSLGLQIQPMSSQSSPSKRKRDALTNAAGQNVTGVTTGLYVKSNGQNLTVLAGHFAASASDGSTINNLAIVNNTNADSPSVAGLAAGVDQDSIFMALALSQDGNSLYAGGMVTGTVRNAPVSGLVAWDLRANTFAQQQLPSLSGSTPYVSAMALRPSSSDLYVGGSFAGAGGLGCSGVCLYSGGQWAKPGNSFDGNVSALLWQGNDQLLVAGNVSVAGNHSALATYDAAKQTWSVPTGATAAVPGPVTALSPASSDASSYWLAGTATNGSAYLVKYDGSNYQAAPQGFGQGTVIRGLSVLSLTQSHDGGLLDPSLVLLVTGALNLPNFGNASAALFNGTTYAPFILSNAGSGPGSLAQVVTESQQSFNTGGGHLQLGFVVLVALAIALGCIFLLILVGLLVERRRRAADGYRPAPQNYFEKTANMGRIPPEHLFGNLNAGTGERM